MGVVGTVGAPGVPLAAAGGAAPKICASARGQRRLHGDDLLPADQRHPRRRGRAVEDDHALELGHRGDRRLQVERLDVEQRILDRDHQQVADDHVRALLVPQGELLRDRRILVHGRLDLGRAVDRGVAREREADGAAVVGRVGLRSEPADHVRSPVGHERQDLHELVAGLPGQAHDHVVGLHLAACATQRGAGRDRPLVVLAVEHVGLGDVVGREHLRLHVEEVLRIPHVGQQHLGHARERREHAGEDLLVGADDGVGRVGDVELHRAVERVDHDLDRVADVVDAAVGLRVRVAVGRRVGVGDPVQLAVGDHHVGVLVERQEGRRGVQALHDVVAQDDAAAGLRSRCS